MTIDTSKEAVERLASAQECGNTCVNFLSAQTIRALSAERDAQTARSDAAEAEVARLQGERYRLAYAITGGEDAPGYLDGLSIGALVEVMRKSRCEHMYTIDLLLKAEAERDAAEAREQALMSSYDAERKALVENAAMRHDIARLTKSLSDEVTARVAAEADVARLRAEITKQMLADEMLCALYDDEAAEVARLNAELRAMRAGQDALVAAAYDAAARKIERFRNGIASKSPQTDYKKAFYAGGSAALDEAVQPLRALTPSDATAALDAMLRAERNKALRDAAEVCVEYGLSKAEECHEAILAMIETEGK